MLLASAPLWEWSLLSSRPTSRAYDRLLRQGDPTRRTKLTNHSPRIHCHCLTQSPAHPASTHSLTQHPSTDRGSIYLPRIQNSGAKVWRVIFFNLQGISCTDVMNQQLTCGPGALRLPWPVKQCLVYLVIVSHPTAASIFFNLHIIRVGWISSSNNSPVDQGHLTLIDHNHNRVPGVPGMVPTSIQTPHIKRVPSISHYRHQAVFVQPIQR